MDNKGYSLKKQEKIIDLRDLLASVFDKWVIVLVFLMLGVLIGAGLCGLTTQKMTNDAVPKEEDIKDAREKLNVDEIAQVDYLYSQYKSYKDYRKMIQDYMSVSLVSDNDVTAICNVLYYIDSEIKDADKCFSILAINKDDMAKISRILGIEEGNLDAVNRKLSISNISTDRIINNVSVDDSDNKVTKAILQVTIAADNEAQIDEAVSVINASFEEEKNKLLDMDPSLEIYEMGRQYTTDVTGYKMTKEQEAITALNYSNTIITDLESKFIEKLSSDEKAYYDAMKEYDEKAIIVLKLPSLKKYIALGGIIGLLLGFIIVALWYVFNGRVKTMVDVSMHSETNVPYVIYKRKPGVHLFGRLSRKLKGADLSEIAVRQEVVYSFLTIKLSKYNCSNAYIACNNQMVWEQDVKNKMEQILKKNNQTLTLYSGNPLTDVEELKHFSESDAIILMIQLKNTRFGIMDKWVELSKQYDRPIIGAIVIEDC